MADAVATEGGLPHIVQYPHEYSLCAGCSTCEIVCALEHEGAVSPRYKRIFLEKHPKEMMHTLLTCQQCTDHPCYEACPRKDDAMRIDDRGIVYIVEERCIGCGKCQKACTYTPSRINLVRTGPRDQRKARKCDLCRNRPEGPACVQWCPVMCIGLSTEAAVEPLAQ